MAKVSEPTAMSSGRSGWLVFWLISCLPLAQAVLRSFFSGSGPRSRSSTTPDSGTRASAPNIVLRISLRRPKLALRGALPEVGQHLRPDLGRPPRSACRSSTISSSDIRVRAQWTAPAPMQNSATPRVRPSAKFSALM